MFCVYFTYYNGNKLPPFYIGSTSIVNINRGYHGSVLSIKYTNTWKQELHDNPQLFKTKIISIHNTRKQALEKELILQKKLDVVCSPMYINMSIASINGYFGRDVSGPNNPNYGKKHSETALRKMRKPKTVKISQQQRQRRSQNGIRWWETHHEERQNRHNKMSGKNNPQYGKMGIDHPRYGFEHTQEAKEKIKNALTGKERSKEHAKHLSTAYKIQSEQTLEIFTGYGLTDISIKLGLAPSSFLYTLTSNKFRNGFRIIENLGVAKPDMLPLVSFV